LSLNTLNNSGLQYAAELTYDMVSPGPGQHHRLKAYAIKKSLSQPGDIREGVSNAYHVVRQVRGFFIPK